MQKRIVLWIAAAIVLAGCSTGGGTVTPDSVIQNGTPSRAPTPVTLVPFHSPTASATVSPAGETPTPIPTPTPTPRSYAVVRGDDLFGIALRHGVPLEVIMTANPTVDPNFLSIGTVLEIPFVAITPTPGQATATPVAMEIRPPDCYATSEGGAWCFLPVENSSQQGVENLVGQVVLSGGSPAALFSAEAVSFLDALLPGREMPLAAFFPDAPRPFAANGQLFSAVPIPAGDARYLPTLVEDLQNDILAGGMSAAVRGSVRLDAQTGSASQVWVLAVAYTETGAVVGVRKVESSEPLAAGGSFDFELSVYSLGPPIDRVELLAEARP